LGKASLSLFEGGEITVYEGLWCSRRGFLLSNEDCIGYCRFRIFGLSS
jgi:hypothetical protein